MTDKELIGLGIEYLFYKRISGMIIHDLHHSLSRLSSSFYLIQRELELKNINRLEHIEEDIERIFHLMRILSTRSGEHRIEMINMTEVIRDSIALFDRRLHKDLIQVEIENDTQIRGNKNQLFQIFMNLFMNSVEATKKNHNPIIRIFCYRDSKYLNLKIEDNGEGITNDFINMVTEKVVEESYKGRINIESTVTKGTTITLQLQDII